MKSLIILILLIYSSNCTMQDCSDCEDQTLCNSIEVEHDDFYCFKANFIGSDNKCVAFPK